jgi:hypothetical protein
VSVGIADQVRVALQVTTRIPAIFGAVYGAAVPLAAFAFSHFAAEGEPTWRLALRWAFVGLCLAFSVPKVFKVGTAVFSQGVHPRMEAAAFALLLEGAMTLADHSVTAHAVVSYFCLFVLVTLNALVCAVAAASDQRAATKERRAEANPDTLSLAPVVPLGVTRTQLQSGPAPRTSPRRTAAKRKAGGR